MTTHLPARHAARLATLACWLREEDGVTSLEYGLLGALIAVAAIAGFTASGGNLSALFDFWTGMVNAAIAGAL